jgi:hypothetical protein
MRTIAFLFLRVTKGFQMTLKGQNRIAVNSHLRVEWRRNEVPFFGRNTCPKTPSLQPTIRLFGANISDRSLSEQRAEDRVSMY